MLPFCPVSGGKSRPGLCFQHNRAGPRLQRTKFEAVRFLKKAGAFAACFAGPAQRFPILRFCQKKMRKHWKTACSLLFPHREHRRHAFQTARVLIYWSCRFEVICLWRAARARRGGGAHDEEKSRPCGTGFPRCSASSFPMCSYALCRWSSWRGCWPSPPSAHSSARTPPARPIPPSLRPAHWMRSSSAFRALGSSCPRRSG